LLKCAEITICHIILTQFLPHVCKSADEIKIAIFFFRFIGVRKIYELVLTSKKLRNISRPWLEVVSYLMWPAGRPVGQRLCRLYGLFHFREVTVVTNGLGIDICHSQTNGFGRLGICNAFRFIAIVIPTQRLRRPVPCPPPPTNHIGWVPRSLPSTHIESKLGCHSNMALLAVAPWTTFANYLVWIRSPLRPCLKSSRTFHLRRMYFFCLRL
jgi:hypothetical protein